MLSAYEQTRLQNIQRNKELLQSLGLDKPFFEPKETRRPRQTADKKRKRANADIEEETEEPPNKFPSRGSSQKTSDNSLSSATSDNSTLRRSTRNRGRTVNYTAEKIVEDPIPVSFKSGVRTSGNSGPLGREDGKRKNDPKVYGTIPGIQVGTWWETRQGCSIDAVHAPWVAGISGNSTEGAYSVALSGGYEDDVDLGYAFTYTGSGGRDLKGTKNAPKNLRTAPQSSDQSFENSFNAALKQSAATGKPVRVIRGFKSESRYAPSEGYRYDGLYRVEKAWMEKGLNPHGYLVCKFAFKRLPGQPPIPVRNDNTDQDSESEATLDHGTPENS